MVTVIGIHYLLCHDMSLYEVLPDHWLIEGASVCSLCLLALLDLVIPLLSKRKVSLSGVLLTCESLLLFGKRVPSNVKTNFESLSNFLIKLSGRRYLQMDYIFQRN